MSGTAVTKVEILFTAKDGSGAGLKAVDAAVKQSAEVAVQASTKSATAAKASASASVAAVQQQHDHHIRMYRDIAQSRERLGVRAERVVQDEIRQTQQAYQTLARSGSMSARELARAQDAQLAKVRELRREINGVKSSLLSPGGVAALSAAAMYVKPAVTRAMGYDHSVAQLTNSLFSDRDGAGRMAGKSEVKAEISKALKYGGSRDQVAATLGELVSSGEFSKESAYKHLGSITKASTASGADPKELSAIVLQAKRMGIADGDMEKVLSKSIRAGQLGGFELKDMGKHLPATMSSAKSLGLSGMEGFERVLTAMQASVTNAGTKDEAANNLINFLEKVNSEDTAKDFKKQGIDLREELAKGAGKGVDSVTTITSLIDRVIAKDPKTKAAAAELDRLSKVAGDKKDPGREDAVKAMKAIYESSVVGKFLQDRQALQGFRAEKAAGEGDDPLTRRVRAGLRKDSAGQELDISYDVMNDTATTQQQRLANATAEGQDQLLTSAGGALKPFYQGVVETAEKFPVMTASVQAATGALGLLAGAAGINAVLGGGGKGGWGSRLFGGAGAGAGAGAGGAGGGGALSALGFAAAPLLAMFGVSEWAGNTSHDQSRASALTGMSELINEVLKKLSLDRDKSIDVRKAEIRAELNVSVSDERVSVTRTKLTGDGVTATMNTGNAFTGAPR